MAYTYPFIHEEKNELQRRKYQIVDVGERNHCERNFMESGNKTLWQVKERMGFELCTVMFKDRLSRC